MYITCTYVYYQPYQQLTYCNSMKNVFLLLHLQIMAKIRFTYVYWKSHSSKLCCIFVPTATGGLCFCSLALLEAEFAFFRLFAVVMLLSYVHEYTCKYFCEIILFLFLYHFKFFIFICYLLFVRTHTHSNISSSFVHFLVKNVCRGNFYYHMCMCMYVCIYDDTVAPLLVLCTHACSAYM